MRTRTSCTIAIAASLGAAIGMTTPPAAAAVCIGGGNKATSCQTGWNFNPPKPPVGANNFEVILPGNQTGIDSANYNSFLSPTHNVSFNGTDTVIKFAGSGLAATGPYGPGNSPQPHFGFTGVVPGATTGGEKLPPVTMEWTVGSKPTVVPGVGLTFHSYKTGPVKFLLLLIQAAAPGVPGATTEDWFELPYQGGYKLSYDASAGAVTLSDAKFFTSPTDIPLDNLNNNDLPDTSPDWQPLSSVPDGTTIPDGGSLTVASVPEPATIVLLGAALLGLGMIARRGQRSPAIPA